MLTKKYYGRSLKDATERMKEQLGSEAVIMSTRVVEKEEGGINRKYFEITSGYEEDQAQLKQILKNQKTELPKKIMPNSQKENLEAKDNKPSTLKPFQKAKLSKEDSTEFKKEMKTVFDTLKQKDLNKDVFDRVINYLKKSENFLTLANLDNFVLTSLGSLIKTKNFAVKERNAGKVISIVGPTGVGKTTCIAKLAAISKIIHNLDIGIISIDTYRLGAIDQLRIFSEISNVDMLVAYEPKDMPGLIKKLKHKDLIFIDTTGRSQRNLEELKKMKEFFENIEVDETYLALSLTSAMKNLYDAAEKFEMFNYDSLIFTKIDEAVTHGNMLNLSYRYQKPIVYITNGQIIPDDILSADSDYIAKLIYNGYN